ncbi:MAG: hypothetical protein J7549_00855 [Variovorax sp.]|nr:hypothetical protein [Variovorax sp.]
MSTTWNFILAGAVTLACAAGVIDGEAAKGELRLAEAAASMSANSAVPAGPTDSTATVISAR